MVLVKRERTLQLKLRAQFKNKKKELKNKMVEKLRDTIYE